jgi:hypothetical protein
MHRALAQMPGLLCHGQLFHPSRSEFAGGVDSFAGYDAQSTEIMHVSAPNFLADLIRSETERTSGFLLRWGQGWHIYEIMFERPNVRLGVLRGDPFLAFAETLKPVHPQLDETVDLRPLAQLPPEALVHRFRQFVVAFCAFNRKVDEMMQSHIDTKPKGWVNYIALGEEPSLASSVPRRGARGWREVEAVEATVHWTAWTTQLGSGFDLDTDGAGEWGTVLDDVRLLAAQRQTVIDSLVACGLNRAALESLKEGSDDPKIVLAFV